MPRSSFVNQVIQDDCIEWLQGQREPFADLIFADPPFNIGYQYDVYADTKASEDYLDWTRRWMEACNHVLKPNGTFWIAIGDDYAAEVCVLAKSKLGLNLRNWVIWHYTFGQNTKRKFGRSHTHLFYFTKDAKRFIFNPNAVRVMSDRQKEYKDKRASEDGKLPFDVWTEFPRLCGTFQGREGWHPCQMPESVLARIVRACSTEDSIVFDPFAGSGTTLVVAKKLGRQYVGTEISAAYVDRINERLHAIRPASSIVGEREGKWPPLHVDELANVYAETAVPTDRLHNEPRLFALFCQLFNRRMASLGFSEYAGEEIWRRLELTRKAGKLPRVRTHAVEERATRVREVRVDH